MSEKKACNFRGCVGQLIEYATDKFVCNLCGKKHILKTD